MNFKADSSSPEMRNARSKIKDLDELREIADREREDGRSVVLCHGVFDLVHMGHVRHFEAARKEGDVLMVTITGDQFVNKGPGRPIFPENLRAEMLAAIEYIDWVGINQDLSAEPVLEIIRPEVYVKGSDYENPEDDVTGKIDTEREAVEMYGGRLVFTKDIIFSSSALINQYLDVYDPPVRDFLYKIRQRKSADDFVELIERVKNFKVLLVGDTIIDEYRYVETLGKASKENIIATRYLNREVFAGGVIAAANHIAGLCADVEIVTTIGDDDEEEKLINGHLKSNVKLNAVKLDGRPTTTKLRFVENAYTRKLFEVYIIDDTPLEADTVQSIREIIGPRIDEFDLVIIADFGHGMLADGLIDLITEKARFLAVNAQLNAGNQGFNLVTKYRRADYICIDAPEARLAAADKYSDISEIISNQLPSRIACDRFAITHGQYGCVTFDKEAGVSHVPAFTRSVVDTIGAGDAFLSITAPLVAAGASMEEIGLVGNAAGAMMVGIVGHRSSIEKAALLRFITTLMK